MIKLFIIFYFDSFYSISALSIDSFFGLIYLGNLYLVIVHYSHCQSLHLFQSEVHHPLSCYSKCNSSFSFSFVKFHLVRARLVFHFLQNITAVDFQQQFFLLAPISSFQIINLKCLILISQMYCQCMESSKGPSFLSSLDAPS